MTEAETDFLRGNAYHDGGHAIVGWVLGLNVLEITICDDQPGQDPKIDGAEHLPLRDRIAVHNAGRQAELVFGEPLPFWASARDQAETLNLLSNSGIRDPDAMRERIFEGCARARELLRNHAHQVHRLATHLIERRQMTADEFKYFMQGAKP